MGAYGVGMPQALYLEQFGNLLRDAFDEIPYHVGSSTVARDFRDVDVRLILDDARYEAAGYGSPDHAHANPKWVAHCLAFSALGKHMTGMPIDFQIQQQTRANERYLGGRLALGVQRDITRHLKEEK